MRKGNKNKFLGIGISILEFCKMRFRKFRADQIFDGYKILSGEYVLIVSEDGTISDILPKERRVMIYNITQAYFHPVL